ncbi:MAG: hypothetical protein Q9162_005015 [Coniocarpon cinnabarinum]
MAPTVEAVEDTKGVVVPDPLTVDTVQALRTKQGKLTAGTAAKADVELFKGVGRHSSKPKSTKQWDHILSNETTTRKPSTIKGAAKHLSKPGIISLGGGLPSAEYFPFDEYSFKVPKLGHFSEHETRQDGATITAGKYDLLHEKSLYDVAVAFNYGQGHGAAQLLRWVIEHTEIVHSPRYSDWQCTMTIGTTSALDMLFRMMGKPGTYFLSEEYTFATVVETAAPYGIKCQGVPVDGQGLLPDALDQILTQWDPLTHDGAPKPYILYTVPSGQNPTGATQGADRRKALYAVAQKHDLVVIEDEPYFFLQMQPYVGQGHEPPPPPKTHQDFLSALVPSYLSMDTDGRVIRVDSFSKVIAPGSRVGWITAPERIVKLYSQHADVSTQGPSGFSQLGLFKLLDEHWGHGGYLDWLVFIRMEYTRRRDVIVGAAEKYLPSNIVSWVPPMAGMFFWVKVDWLKHPQADQVPMRELEDQIWLKTIDNGALVLKGSWFRADQGRGGGGRDEGMFFRMTFAAAKEADMEEAVRRFGESLRDEFGLKAMNGVNGHANGYANGPAAGEAK